MEVIDLLQAAKYIRLRLHTSVTSPCLMTKPIPLKILLQTLPCLFSARRHICRARYMLSPVRMSICLSVRHTGGSVKNG